MAILCRKSANSTTRIVQVLVASISLFLSCSPSFAQVMFTDDFASGDLSKTQNGFKWTSSAWAGVVSFQGSNVLRFSYKGSPPGNDAWAEQRFTLGNYYTDVWIQYDMYVPANYTLRESSNDKSYLYLWTDGYNAQNGVGAGFQNWGKTNNGSNLAFVEWSAGRATPHLYDYTRNPQAFDDHKGKWTNIIANIKAGTGSGDGSGRLWRDGVLVFVKDKTTWNNKYSISQFMYTAGLNNKFNNGYLMGWSNNGFDVDTNIYIDNFKFSTTPLIMNFDPPSAPIAQ